MAAIAQRFSELNPGVEILWEKRSLQAFADQPIGRLAETYDLLVLDHPWAGFAARTGAILPLDDLLPAEFLRDQHVNSVGASSVSYNHDGRQWALAIDAAAPVASYRPDLFEEHGLKIPATWDDVLVLAREGWVTMPGVAIDSLMHFYMMCCSLGEDPFQSPQRVVSPATGAKALRLLRELAALLGPETFSRNPIRVYEAMAGADDCAYCPFAYGYSNYSRRGYARKELHFVDLASLGGSRLRSTLGGAGLAISARSTHRQVAARYAALVGSARIQSTLYVDAGGQPGHRAAWEDDAVNRSTADFFRNTLPALDRAFLRPRYHGYMHFQDNAGAAVREYLMHGGAEEALLQNLGRLYQESLEHPTP